MPAFSTEKPFIKPWITVPFLLSLGLGGFVSGFSGFGCQSQPYKKGEALYKAHCANCHMPDGTGLEGNIPPLAKSDFFSKKPVSAACIIRNGLQDTIWVNGRVYFQPMAPIPQLNELEIANIINYVGNSWGNKTRYISLGQVKKELEQCD